MSEQSPPDRSEPAAKETGKPWYSDPSKVVGVLGFLLALGTLGERMWVRGQEQTNQRLQQLREVTATLADIQAEYLTVLQTTPANTYALGIAHNIKRQMLLQTGSALLQYPAVKRQASAQILAALGAESNSDGRHEVAQQYLTAALTAPGVDDALRPALYRSLGLFYSTPNTKFTNADTARSYFKQALDVIDKRTDDVAHLVWAETILTEASMEVTYGDKNRAKSLADQALERIARVRSLSPFRTQLERLATGFASGQQYAEIQASLPRDSAAKQSPIVDTSGEPTPGGSIESWALIPNQVSGIEMDVSVDGKFIGQLSNLQTNSALALPPLTQGVHKFTFANMKAYFVDPAKGPTVTGANYVCTGWFELAGSNRVLKANVGSGPNGLVCSLQ